LKAVFLGLVLLVTIFSARKLRAQNNNQHAAPLWRSILIENTQVASLLMLLAITCYKPVEYRVIVE
jgi:hypothetical protein